MHRTTRTILIAVIAVLAAALLGLVIFAARVFDSNDFRIDMELVGQEEITLEYGSTYVDQGVTAWVYGTVFLKEGQQVTDIRVDNPVDTSKIGTYQITYTAEFNDKDVYVSKTMHRTVHIVDTQAPTIELVINPDGYTFPGHSYEEEGFTATDGYDGDITDKVERTEENGVVTYRVKDSSGNEAMVTRTIVYADPEEPVLTLKGDSHIVLPIGGEYVEPGYTAADACDGDLTDKVVVTGEITNKYAAGTYTFTYTVTDAAGNTATVTRTVEVQAANNPDTVTPSGKIIYLTFDDGPGPYTGKLLDVLAKYNVKATFFVVHTGYYDTLRRIVNEGHAIGVHATEHNYGKIYASEDAYFADLENMKRIIYEQTGVTTQLIRFPGGSSNTVSSFNKGIMTRLVKAVRAAGYQYFDWNVDSNDAGGAKTAEKVFENVVNGCKQRRVSVVLQHDIKKYSVEAVEQIIIWGLENGYTFLPLDITSPGAHHGLNN